MINDSLHEIREIETDNNASNVHQLHLVITIETNLFLWCGQYLGQFLE